MITKIHLKIKNIRKKMSHKLSNEQKKEIKKLLEMGYSPTDVAEKYKVSRITIYNIGRKRDDKI